MQLDAVMIPKPKQEMQQRKCRICKFEKAIYIIRKFAVNFIDGSLIKFC